MRAALFLSERKAGLSSSDANKILRTLQALELPLVLPDGIDTATVLQKTASDKKFRAGTAVAHALSREACISGLMELLDRNHPLCSAFQSRGGRHFYENYSGRYGGSH